MTLFRDCFTDVQIVQRLLKKELPGRFDWELMSNPEARDGYIIGLMKCCWEFDPEGRPKARQILKELDHFRSGIFEIEQEREAQLIQHVRQAMIRKRENWSDWTKVEQILDEVGVFCL